MSLNVDGSKKPFVYLMGRLFSNTPLLRLQAKSKTRAAIARVSSPSHSDSDMAAKLPSHRMAVSPDKSLLVLAFGHHLQVFDIPTSKLLSSTITPDAPTANHNHNALLRLLLIHHDTSSSNPLPKSPVLITTGEDKLLKTWQLPSLKLINSRELIKRATSIAVSPNGKNIVIADKFGDVYNLPFDAPSQTVFQSDPDQEEPKGSETIDKKSDGSKPKPILPIAGHVSLLTSVAFIPCEPSPLLVTADRDEHVRISQYPQAWSIFSYLLGHRKFVSALLWLEKPHLLVGKDDSNKYGRLLTAGGDDEIYVWDHLRNVCVKKILINGLANGMKAWPHKQLWFSKNRSNKRRRKTLDQSNNKSSNKEKKNEDDESMTVETPDHQSQSFVQKTCVNKMISIPPSERNGTGYVLATSVGSSTIAAIPMQSIFDSSQTTGCIQQITRYLDLDLPILDIVALSDHHVLLSLDHSFSSSTTPPHPDTSPLPSFRIISLFPDKIEESTDPAALNLTSLTQMASVEVSKELPMPSQEALYAELILFTKLEDSLSNHHQQAIELRGSQKDPGRRSGKKVEGRLLSQKRCEILLAKSALANS